MYKNVQRNGNKAARPKRARSPKKPKCLWQKQLKVCLVLQVKGRYDKRKLGNDFIQLTRSLLLFRFKTRSRASRGMPFGGGAVGESCLLIFGPRGNAAPVLVSSVQVMSNYAYQKSGRSCPTSSLFFFVLSRRSCFQQGARAACKHDWKSALAVVRTLVMLSFPPPPPASSVHFSGDPSTYLAGKISHI
jgi:hypothetical protein